MGFQSVRRDEASPGDLKFHIMAKAAPSAHSQAIPATRHTAPNSNGMIVTPAPLARAKGHGHLFDRSVPYNKHDSKRDGS